MNFQKLYQYYIPTHQKSREYFAPDYLANILYEWRWKQWLHVMWLVSAALTSLFFVRIFSGYYDLTIFNYPVIAIVFSLVFPGFARKSRNYDLMASLSLIFGTAYILFEFWKNKNIDSAMIYWVGLPPMAGVLFFGARAAMITFLCEFILLISIQVAPYPDFLQPLRQTDTIKMIVVFVTTILYTSIAVLVEKMRENSRFHQKQLQMKLKEAQEENLKIERLKAKSAILISMHHEINNPLAIAIGTIQSLLKVEEKIELQQLELELQKLSQDLMAEMDKMK